jgi:tight adherence protein B
MRRSSWSRTRRARGRAAVLADQGRDHTSDATRPVVEPALAAGVAAAVGLVLLGPATTALGSVVALVGLAWWRRQRGIERARRRRAQLPDALERVAGGLRSGSSLPQALADTGAATTPPLGPELVGLAHDARHGRRLDEVLDAWAERHHDRGTRLAATAMVLASSVGAAPARALDGVAATVRERLQLRDERRALATQARTSAAVLAVAPLVFLALFGVTDSAAAGFLLGTPAGWLCLVAGVVLDLVGTWWMARLTDPGDDR